jgi:hypothetical protein
MMPNVRIYLESRILHGLGSAAPEIVAGLRPPFCRAMQAEPENCHFMLFSALGIDGQAECYVDMDYRPSAARTIETVQAACSELAASLGQAFGVRVRIRAKAQDPARTVATG